MAADPWLVRLNAVPSLGPLALTRLVERFGSARAVLGTSPRVLATVPGVTLRLATSLREAADAFDPDDEAVRCADLGVGLIARGDADYPAALRFLPDPPPLLYAQGRLSDADGLAVAVVGARRCTSYGRRQARRFGVGLARGGVTVVSGLARGVDSAAHRGALETGGRTLAVLGSGLARIYPSEHEGLAAAVAEGGCVLTEFSLDAPPRKHHFPRRNRVIAGLSFGVVVVEAAPRSGSLITAMLALDCGREVYAVPGPVDSDLSRGVHRLLREGARLVEGPEEILADLGLASPDAPSRDEPPADPVARRVLAALPADRSVLPDEIVQDLGLPAGAVVAALGTLALEGRVAGEPGGRWARA